MRKIAVVTGTRADYEGYLKPLMKLIDQDSDLKLIPIFTGMHLLPAFGDTHELVERDFPKSVKVEMNLEGDSLKDMANYFASGVKNFTDYFTNNKPDILVVLGDRSESLAAAFAAMYLNIPIAHINGGDISGGTIDESIRHALTKIAHIHLVHTQENAERVRKMGEDKNRIFVVGALTLDTILNKNLPSKKAVFENCKLDPTKITFLVVQHPVTILKDQGYSQMRELLSALKEVNKQTVMLYPNCDAGGMKLIDLIKKYENENNFLKVFKNLPHEEYLTLMKSSKLMIGNSSSGIIEAPSFKIPVINIGKRQSGRSRTENIIDVKPEKKEILESINFALSDKEFLKKLQSCKNKFGDGKASEKIVKILKEVEIDNTLIQKQITY